MVKANCNFSWTVNTEVGKRITKISVYEPVFGYRVDLNTPWEVHRQAEKKYHEVVDRVKRTFLDVSAKYGAEVEVYNATRSIYVKPQQIIDAETVEQNAVKIVAKALRKIKDNVEKHSQILSIDSVMMQAKKQI